MLKIFDSRRFFLPILFICILFSFVKSDNETNGTTQFEPSYYNITLLDKTEYYSTNYFKVDLKNKRENYLKIQVEGYDEYAIIYYKNDSLFKNRNQIVKSSSYKTKMWLNNAEFNQEFYLSVMCLSQNCTYSLEFEYKSNLELEYGEFYSYYVTEETRTMEFYISGTAFFDREKDGDLSVWAQGYKEISTKIKPKSILRLITLYEKKVNKYGLEAYQMPIDNKEELSVLFTVKGTPGDLINVGALVFSNQNICTTPIQKIKGQISGFLTQETDYNKEACFIFPENEKPNINTLLEGQSLFKFEANNGDNTTNIYCLKMINNNDVLYSFSYNKNEQLYDKINVLPPLAPGEFYRLNMKKGENVGLLPMLSDTYFNYLTYKILEKKGKYKAYITNCDNYPFYCSKSTDKEYLINYNSASKTFLKNDFINAFSPFDSNQTMMVVECESDICEINANIYTDKNPIAIESLISYQNFIDKNNEAYLKLNSSYQNFIIAVNFNESALNIVPITSSCEIINSNDAKIYNINNNNTNYSYNDNNNTNNAYMQYFYEIENIDMHNHIPDFTLKLNSKEKTVYSVAILNITKRNIYSSEIAISPGMNYFITMDNKTNETIVKIMNSSLININEDSIYYISFYSDNCNINVNGTSY